jgi:LPXTG-motif cell wall-anchored protein
MRKIGYLGVLVTFFALVLAPISFAEAQESTISIPQPVQGGETPVGGMTSGVTNDPIGTVERVPGGETPVGGGEVVGGRITDPVEETPVDSDQYDEDDKISIPEPVPGGETPVEGPPTGGDEVTELPDTGGVSGLMLMAGALLLGGGLMVRRISR